MPRLQPLSRACCAIAALALTAPLAAQTAASPAAPNTPSTTSFGVDYGYDYFAGDLDPWHLAAVSIGRRTAAGSIIGRLNYANRFATSGTQVEVDAYPKLSRSTYAYVNAGYSRDAVFPNWRVGAELFGNLPHAWEASAGFRQLRFGGAPVTLLTGTVGKYVGNSWISLRPTVRHRDTGLSASASLTARQYFADADTYLGARASYGSAPSDRLTPNELVARERSWSAAVQGSRTVRRGATVTASFGRDVERLSAGVERRRWTATAGLRLDVKRHAR